MVSEAVKVARHCMYRPEGSPEVTGEVPPTGVQEGVASPFKNTVLDALTSKVISVFVSRASSQNRLFHTALDTVVSRTWDAIVPGEEYEVVFSCYVPRL